MPSQSGSSQASSALDFRAGLLYHSSYPGGEDMGSIGVPELIIIFVVALIVFGPKKLPELGKSLGKGLAEFRRASNELKATLEEEVRAIENETHATPHYETESKPSLNSSTDVNVDAH